MGRSYYYFAASLPMIEFQGKLPISTEAFLEDCQRLLTYDDYTLLEGLLSEKNGQLRAGNDVYQAYSEFNKNFRNEMAWYRSERANKDPLANIRGERYPQPFLDEIIHQASRTENLLDAEKMLDRARWQFLDELVVGHYYDIEFLIIYGIKLKILERYDELHSPKGMKIFEEYKHIDIAQKIK